MTDTQFVSRGGLKLQAAIENWSPKANLALEKGGNLKIENSIVLDVGSSTGGFVDCLLQNGALKVYAVDTAYGELAWKLRNDERVVVMERTNILFLDRLGRGKGIKSIKGTKGIKGDVILNPKGEGSPTPAKGWSASGGNVGSQGFSNTFASLSASKLRDSSPAAQNDNLVDLITIDAGWTKLEKVLPVVRKFLKPEGQIVALLKPHYETEQKNLRKGVVPEELVESIKDKVLRDVEELGFKVEKVMDSPILGGGGNKEFLVLLSLS
jgi:predicted rRNA methylase YqxC with S4 and FtsJ domains